MEKALAEHVKISIVIPAFNEQKMIRRSLRAITKAADAFLHRSWKFEIIVCDNNSSDKTSEFAKEEGASVIFESINQIARARNTGASAASGDWLLFVDADSFPSYELFDDMASHISRGDILGGGAVVQMEHGPKMVQVIASGWNLISRYKRWMAGSFIFCERSAFERIGGFSHEFYAAEEIEFSKRLHVVAKASQKRIVILKKFPLVTSARKAYLYSTWDHLKFFGRTILGGGKSLKQREECILWYDGKR